MSGADEDADSSIISTRLRACEACKTRKIKCDKLAPCSACKSANIPCRTAAPVRNPLEKKQRVALSSRYEDQIGEINEKLSQLQVTLSTLTKSSTLGIHQRPSPHSTPRSTESGDVGFPSPWPTNSPRQAPHVSKRAIPYLGESSFEMHSQQTGRLLEQTLNNSPASNANYETQSTLQALREVLREGENKELEPFSTTLSMIPKETALRVLHLISVNSPDAIGPGEFLLYTPMVDVPKFKEICQKVYFPMDGYTMSEFIVANGGLLSILVNARADFWTDHGLDAQTIEESVAICERNVSMTINRISPFLDPTDANIEMLLFASQVALAQSKVQQAWTLISMSARLCLDSGLNRLKDPPEGETMETHTKKTLFWFTYALDKQLALNFGRTSNFSDFDITTPYSTFPDVPVYGIYKVWLDLAVIQGKIYDRLYSAQGQIQSPQQREQIARALAREILDMRIRCKKVFASMPDQDNIPFTDTEVTILSNLTLVYRALPTPEPDNPLMFAEDCIWTAREALQVHTDLCAKFFDKKDNSLRMYIDWNLSFCPFTPFIVVLGASILETNNDDLVLLSQVVDSLEMASTRAPGANKLHRICKILLKGAKSCIEQNLSQGLRGNGEKAAFDASSSSRPTTSEQQYNPGLNNTQNGQMFPPENWDTFQLDSMGNMSMLFDNYLAGNSGMMPIWEADLTRFDTMDFDNTM